MAGALVLPFALVLGLVAAVLVAVLARRHALVVGVDEHVHLVAYARRARAWRLAALALAVVACVAIPMLGLGGTDTAPAVVPAVAGILVVVLIGLGEASFRRPMTVTRSADLRPRRLGDLVPRGWLITASGALLALTGALVVGTLYGSADDLGRAGRAISVVCDGVTHTRTPWPGSHYALPIALATAVSVLVAAATCVVVARRPSPAAESVGLDAELRRWSIAGVLQSLTLVACMTLTPVLVLMAIGARASDCAPGGYGLLAELSLVGAAAATVVGVVAFAGLCSGPGVRVDDVPPPQRGEPTPVGVPL
ncbi:hypothetical protein [Janibacter terrae]|uniref:hypothetical protein n=1 Tax=Janibacter terrae TaxID=103817 RepID=UPI000831E309|nr:hypothetical protein [Janibacter terrae]